MLLFKVFTRKKNLYMKRMVILFFAIIVASVFYSPLHSQITPESNGRRQLVVMAMMLFR